MEQRENQEFRRQNSDNQKSINEDEYSRLDIKDQLYENERPNKGYEAKPQNSALPDYKYTPPEPEAEQSNHGTISGSRLSDADNEQETSSNRADNIEDPYQRG